MLNFGSGFEYKYRWTSLSDNIFIRSSVLAIPCVHSKDVTNYAAKTTKFNRTFIEVYIGLIDRNKYGNTVPSEEGAYPLLLLFLLRRELE